MHFSCTSFSVRPPSFFVLRCPLSSLLRLSGPLLLPHTFPSLSVSALCSPPPPPTSALFSFPTQPSPLHTLHSIFFAFTLLSTEALIPPPTVANVSNPGRFNNCFPWLQTPFHSSPTNCQIFLSVGISVYSLSFAFQCLGFFVLFQHLIVAWVLT